MAAANMMVIRQVWPSFEGPPKRAGLWVLFLGLLSATGFEPLGLWPLALLGAGAGIWLIGRCASWQQAAWQGWLFGIAHFTLGNNWIATAFTYQANMPAVLGWLGVLLLALYLAIFPAIAAAAARACVRSTSSWGFTLLFAGFWIICEWLRSWLFTGYAWNPFGTVLLGPLDRTGLAILAPFTGTYALSGIAIFVSASLIGLAVRRKWIALSLLLIAIVLGMYWPASQPQNGELDVTIVQPDIRQEKIHDPAFFDANFARLAKNSTASEGAKKRVVLWPESGMVDYLREGYPQGYYSSATVQGSPRFARRRLGAVVGENSVLLTGAVELEIGEVDGFSRAIGARNAVTALNSNGVIIAGYNKAHLVPFGEYLPLRSILEPLGLDRFVPGSMDFWPGQGPRTLDLGEHGKVGVQICYEIIFSGEVVEGGARPDYIFNPSNDGWFGRFGPPQHLAQARLRAVEEGLPVLRATTTGISAIIDAKGVVRAHLPWHKQGRIDGSMPRAAQPTLFARLGNILGFLWAALFLGAGFIAIGRNRG